MKPGGFPKRIKRELSKLSRQAYENELNQVLESLAEKFDEWRAGKLDAGELSFLIHECDTGPLWELFRLYNRMPVDVRVGYAVVHGVLKEEGIPAEVWPYVEGAIELYRRQAGEADETEE